MSNVLDGGEFTVAPTEGWEAPPGADPLNHWISGVAQMGNTPFRMPVITQIEGNLWTGGYVPGLHLASLFKNVISLYPWGKYPTNLGVEYTSYRMYDSAGIDEDGVQYVTNLAALQLDDGPLLIHCQAGLNRSALVAGNLLMRLGKSADEAIELLRAQRSPAVLCNGTFERWLRSR